MKVLRLPKTPHGGFEDLGALVKRGKTFFKDPASRSGTCVLHLVFFHLCLYTFIFLGWFLPFP